MVRIKLDKFKANLPQIYAAFVVSMVYMCVGIGVAYSAVLIPQLKNGTGAVNVTNTEELWIVNCINIVIPIFAIFSGFATDFFGRLWVLKATIVPHFIGYAAIAMATTSTIIIVGRVLTGVALVFHMGCSYVYISEISSPNLRGTLLAIPIVLFTLGTLLTYLMGYFLSWDTIAWMACAYGTVSIGLLFSLPLSPSWLISKNRTDEAVKSLKWLNQFQTGDKEFINQIVQTEISKIEEEEEDNKKRIDNKRNWKIITLPTVYKPLAILVTVLFLQQFSGVILLLMNTIIFFNEAGTPIDPYLASTYMSIARLGVSFLITYMMKRCGRRPLLMISFIGMAVSMGISGLYTKWIKDGVTENTWVPLSMLTIYIGFTVGVMAVPFALSGETFPLNIRGFAATLAQSLLYFFSFVLIYSYPLLLDALGGIHNVQYFFASFALIGALFTFLFVPETLNKRLSEIESYFWNNTLAITYFKKSDESHSQDSS